MVHIANMQRCTHCSGAALRLFIQDLTGFIPRPDSKLNVVHLRKALPLNNYARKSFSTTSVPCGLRREVHSAQNDYAQLESEKPLDSNTKIPKVDDKPSERTANEEHHQDASQKEPESSHRIEIHDEAVQTSVETASDRQQRRLLRKIERLQEGKYKGRMNSKFTKEQAIEHLGKRLSELERPSSETEQSEHIQVQAAARPTHISNRSPAKPVSKPVVSTSHKKPSNTGKPKRETWQTQKNALTAKFGTEGWQPRKRLSPDALEGIRSLHASDPKMYSTPVLANQFAVTPEAIRRILKSKWKPSEGEAQDRAKRWERRGERKWKDMAALGVKPPKKWREKGIRVDEDGVGG